MISCSVSEMLISIDESMFRCCEERVNTWSHLVLPLTPQYRDTLLCMIVQRKNTKLKTKVNHNLIYNFTQAKVRLISLRKPPKCNGSTQQDDAVWTDSVNPDQCFQIH